MLPAQLSGEHAADRMPMGQLSALLKVSTALAASLDLTVVLQTAIESAVELMGLETGAIFLLDGGVLHLGATVPRLPAEIPEESRLAPLDDHPHARECLASGDPLCVDEVAEETFTPAEKEVLDGHRLESILYVPLRVESRQLGTFVLGSTTGSRAFTAADLDLCRTLSCQVAMAVTNAELFASTRQAANDLEYAYDATLAGWSLALEMRDEETNGHTERVAAMTVELAARMGICEHQRVHLRRGALLHDIGKMVIPDAILHKPAALSDEEWTVMRRHPEHARDFLAKIDYLSAALDVPYCHHERWDGTGYPRGLQAEEIPLAARIFAVVDVFDALTSDRPYRSAWSREEALEHIQREAGSHFDPQVVDVFLSQMTDQAA